MSRPPPPPLPPRTLTDRSRSSSPSASSQISMTAGVARKGTIHLSPSSASQPRSPRRYDDKHPYRPPPGTWATGEDPRSSSMHSLRPIESASEGQRKLLLVYIHGFLGNETSFKSFPAHVHNLLTLTLVETHVVHTKIYPRYKSRRDISFARDDFSNWLYPHESPTTDVILLGHSLGGILAAEVALLRSNVPNSFELHQHRILGVIAFDTPFLGMHPSVIKTGLASLFRSSPELPELPIPDNVFSGSSTQSSSLGSPSESISPDLFSPPANDPNYNPSFLNDIIRPQRTKLDNAWHFWNKHYGEMTKATKSYVTSHFEFGGCMADYPGLKKRYEAIRSLEDIDDLSQKRDSTGKLLRRVRFVNYYSASTGPVKTKQNATPKTGQTGKGDLSLQTPTTPNSSLTPPIGSTSPAPRLSVEEHRDGDVILKDISDMYLAEETIGDHHSDTSSLRSSLARMSPDPMPHSDNEAMFHLQPVVSEPSDDLPPIPPLAKPPPDFDASKFSAKDTLKVAQKEHDRQVKAYERAKKDREKSIRDREKMIKKREKTAAKQQAKAEKLLKAQEVIDRKESLKRITTLNPETYEKQMYEDAADESISVQQLQKKKKDKKFCTLPSKDPRTGLRDSTWIRVYMEGVDEVVAHTSLFFVSETYAKLVGDTATRIEDWVHADATKNTMLAEIEEQKRSMK